MALDVTPGSPDAEAYWSIADINAYAEARGKAFPITGTDGPATAAAVAAAEAAARRGAAWVDGRYRGRFPGVPTNADQAMEWPRSGAWFRGHVLPDDEIPVQIGRASAEAAIRELASPGSLYPAATGGAILKRRRVGPIEQEWDTSGAKPTDALVLTAVDDILGGLISPRSATIALVRA